MLRMGMRFILMFTAALFLTSCASSKRMMRLSPFSSKNPKKVSYDESQVNLWPLFYNKGNFNSILWPVIDSDPKGFAVRPLYNQDGHEYSILFPLCAWNPVNGDGWALNTYWDKKRIGSFPLFHLGNKNKFNYVLPVWWDNDWSKFGTLGVMFSDNINFIGPLWYDKKASSGGIFPVFNQSSGWGWLFPLYNYKNNRDEFYLNFVLGALGRFASDNHDSHYRFLNAFYVNKYEKNYHGFIPVYYYEQERNKKLLVTPLGGRGWNAGTGENSLINILGPLYIKTHDKKQNEEFEAFCWPLYFYSKSHDEINLGSFPLFWYRSDSFLNILGPLFHKTGNSYSVLWPLSFYSKSSCGKKYGSFPLFWYEKNKDNGFLNILGLIWDYRWNRNSWNIFSLLTFGVIEHKYYNEHILPGENYTRRRIYMKNTDFNPNRLLKEKYSFHCLLFWENNKRKYTIWKTGTAQKELDKTRKMLQKIQQLNNRIRSDEKFLKNNITKAEFLSRQQYQSDERQINIKETAQLLKKLNIPILNLTDNKAIRKTRYAIRDKYCKTIESRRISIPFLYTYNEYKGDYKWDIFWFLANGKKQKDYEKISILRYLYRYERTGDTSSRIIFPFMTYKTAPNKSKFSFLWRVFNYKRENKKISGHIFFIPF